MTKTNEQKFEEKSFIMRLAENMDAVAWSKPNDRHYAWQYAMWAYQQAISDVLEKLRKARNNDGSYVGAAKCKDMRLTADWLEEQFKRDGV